MEELSDASVGNIVSDDASIELISTKLDSGFHSGQLSGLQHLVGKSLSPAGVIAPHHHPGDGSAGSLSPHHLPPRATRVEYNRLDSGLCESFDQHMRLDQPQQHQQAVSRCPVVVTPSPSFIEYYDADVDGDCQLHLAIASGCSEVVFALIRMAPHPSYLDIQNNELYAPIHIAVLMNQPSLVRRLVVAGATTDIRDREGNTPLHLAAKRGYLRCAEALLRSVSVEELRDAAVACGASPGNLRTILDLKNYHGEHSVHLATFGQHYDFLRFLHWMEADLNAMEGRSGKTALHYAVNKRDLDMVILLAGGREAGGCGVWLNSRDWAGRTPLECAKINGDTAIFSVLAAMPGCELPGEDSDEDFQFDTDDETAAGTEFNDIEVNGSRVVESAA